MFSGKWLECESENFARVTQRKRKCAIARVFMAEVNLRPPKRPLGSVLDANFLAAAKRSLARFLHRCFRWQLRPARARDARTFASNPRHPRDGTELFLRLTTAGFAAAISFAPSITHHGSKYDGTVFYWLEVQVRPPVPSVALLSANFSHSFQLGNL